MLKKILISLFLVYSLFGFIAVPLILKPLLIDTVSQQTKAKLEIESVFFNPFAFYLNVSGVKMSSLEDKQLITIEETHVNLELYSLLSGTIHVKNFILEEPEINLALDKDKNINFSSILKESKPKQEDTNATKTQLPRIILDKVAVQNASLNYEDYSQKSKFEFKLDTIGFELNDVDTHDFNSSDANIRFYTRLDDGGFIDVKSEVIGFEPLVLKGTLDFEASKLYTQWRYVKDMLNLEVADGKLSLNTSFMFNLQDIQATTISNLNINLDKLRVKPKGNHKDVLSLESLHLENATIKPFQEDVKLEKMGINSLNIRASRDTQGLIDWLEYVKVKTEPSEEVEEETQEKEASPWNVSVGKLALEKINIVFDDGYVKPNVQSTLNELNIYAQNITLAGKEPMSYQIDMTLNKQLRCNFNGSLAHDILDASAYIKCSDLDVIHFLPYIDDIANKELDVYNVKLRTLMAGFDANVSVKDTNSSLVIDVNDANIHLNDFAMNKRSTNKRLLTFTSFDVSGIKLNTQRKEVFVKDTNIKYANLRTARLDDGKISLDGLVVAKKKKTVNQSSKTKDEKPYRIKMKKLALKGAKVSFEDKMMQPSVKAKIDNIYLSAHNLDSKKYSWAQYYLSARVNAKGKLKAKGSVRHSPLKQKGSLSLSKLALKDINPYIKQSVYVYLHDGYLSLDSKMKYAPSQKAPDLSMDGSFKLEELFVNDSRDDETLVSLSQLNLKSFTLETSPNRLFVEEVDVDAFYVNALIDANKSMNLGSLLKGTEEVEISKESNSTVQTQEEVVVLDTITVKEKKSNFPVRVMKVNIKDGSAVFADASLPINFKTNIHDLNGVVYAVSSEPNETSYINLVGEVDAYGSTKLKGSIDIADPKAYTDLDFNFRNLNLSSMSGYSATFAGHKIDEGKLFLNLNYDIEDSQLKGENSIIVKKIKLGEEMSVEGGSSLPLGFVIALLEDSNGVIDIDMPIRGNVDEPDFKYGALVWKTLGNLILKAVASPFKFLGSMLGIGGDELEYAEFEAGSIIILPPEREKLDNIAKLLFKRPKMMLSIGGTYNPQLDKASIQRIKLSDLVVKLSGAKNENERISAMNIDLLEDIYKAAKGSEKLEFIEKTLEKKHDNNAKFERAYLKVLVKECVGIQDVSITELKSLATQRSRAVKNYLVDTKGIALQRIKELEIKEVLSDDKEMIQTKLEVIVK